MSTFALRFNKNCDMDYLPKDPAILVSSVNMLHGFVYSEEQRQFRPIGYDSVTK